MFIPCTHGVAHMTKMWGTFFLSILLVSTLNFYAVVREPDRVDISDIHEHVQETVKVQGTLISWVADPYSDGSDLITLQIEDDADVVKVNWRETSDDLPPIGATVIVEGQVREYNGKIFIESKGMGAVTQKESVEVKDLGLTLSDFGKDPEKYDNEIVSFTGYLGYAIEPNENYQTFTLTDNPTFLNSDHRLYVSLQGRVNNWIEAGSKIDLTGWVQFDERNFRWQIIAQSSTIDVIDATEAKQLSWQTDPEMWSYDVGKLVQISGEMAVDEDGLYWIMPPSNSMIEKLCILPTQNMQSSVPSGELDYVGRLIWSEERVTVCLEMTGFAPTLVQDENAPQYTELAEITSFPTDYIGQYVNVTGYTTYALEPNADPNDVNPKYSGYIGNHYNYISRTAQIRFEGMGTLDTWTEKGTQVNITNARVEWDASSGRLELIIDPYTSIFERGEVPEDIDEEIFDWTSSWDMEWDSDFPDRTAWTYQINDIVNVTGEMINEDGINWIKDTDSEGKLCLVDSNHDYWQGALDESTTYWEGRLVITNIVSAQDTRICLQI